MWEERRLRGAEETFRISRLSEASAVSHEFKRGLETAIQRRFQGCARSGDELAASPRVLAQLVLATMRGLSQLATDGATRRDLLKVADHAAESCLRSDTASRG